MTDDPLVSSLLAAVVARPDDVPLRLHVAGVLLDRGRPAQAVEHCSAVLSRDGSNAEAIALLARASHALAAATGVPDAGVPEPGVSEPGGPGAAALAADASTEPAEPTEPTEPAEPTDRADQRTRSGPGGEPTQAAEGAAPATEFDWSAAEEQVRDIAAPPFVGERTDRTDRTVPVDDV